MAPSSSGKAPDCKSGFTGSIPVGAFKYSRSSAEEQLGDIEKVGGSIPLVSTITNYRQRNAGSIE